MNKLIISLLFVLFVVSTGAQKIEEYFLKMPDDMIVQLEEAWRNELVDMYKSGKTATLENSMQGESTLLKLTNDYLLLQSTERTTIELKCLPFDNNTNVICMITTVSAPVADSRVDIYTTNWIPLDNIFTPVADDWFWKDNINRLSPDFIDANAALDMCLIKYSLSAENTYLTAEYMTPQYLDDELRKKVIPLLKNETKTFKWKINHFE